MALAALAAAVAVLSIVDFASTGSKARAGGQVREYWVAAVPVNWHVVPNERDAIMGQAFDPAKTTFETVVYRQYTKDWARQIPNAAGDEGIQGPVLHANVGDKIRVHFENLDTVFNQPHSMHFHGVHYRPGSDGSYVPGFSGPGANVAPGKTFTYRLTAGPDSAGVWPYHDHSPSMDESIAGGLYGVLSILGPGSAAARTTSSSSSSSRHSTSRRSTATRSSAIRRSSTPRSATSSSGTSSRSARTSTPSTSTATAGSSPTARASTPERSARRRASACGGSEDDPGTWLYHCHVEGHMAAGMIGIYRVSR